MAFDVTALPTYVEQNSDSLLRKAILGAESAKMFTLQTGVKTKTALNLLSTTIALQAGKACGWNASGSSKITQRTITATPLKVNMNFCDKELMDTCLQHGVRVAAGQKSLPFEEEFTSDVTKNVSLAVEKLIWQGDTSSTDEILKWGDGLLKILNASDGITVSKQKISVSAAPTLSTVRGDVNNVILAIPTEVLNEAVVFMGYDMFRLYVMALQNANLYHEAGDGLDKGSMYYQGSNILIKAVAGLDGTNCIVAADPQNFFYGTDLMGDDEKFDLWYSKDAQEFRLAIGFSTGVQVAFPNECVISAAPAS